MIPDQPSLITAIFGGILSGLIICQKCEAISTSIEKFFVISLSIPLVSNTFFNLKKKGKSIEENDLDQLQTRMQQMNIKNESVKNVLKQIEIPNSESQLSLLECLNKFMEVEILNGENQRRCLECTKNSNEKESVVSPAHSSDINDVGVSYKRYLFSSIPKILVFHLKRFQLMGLFKTMKIDIWVDFEEFIDIKQYLIPQMPGLSTHDSTRYQLYGLVVHSGGLMGGHYISYVRRNDSDSWFYCSDSHTHTVSWNQVKKCQAYILFYRLIL